MKTRFSQFAGLFIGTTLVLAGCSSSEAEPTVADSPDVGDVPAELPATPSGLDETEGDTGGSGPGGLYMAGDVFDDGEFEFTYGGLIKTSLNPEGEHADGECYFMVGTAKRTKSTAGADLETDTFPPSVTPIFAGTADKEQNNEFFNCDYQAMTDAGFLQTHDAELAIDQSADIWLDAIYVTPARAGQLESVALFGSEDLLFDAEVTQDLRD